MKSYNPVLPANYPEIQRIGIEVSNTILDRKIPQPSKIAMVLGEDNVRAYYLMHALLWAIEHRRSPSTPDYKRRDRKAIQRHSFDASFRPLYRFADTKESKIPSRYILTPREVRGVLVHDLGEEFGQSLMGALIVNDVISYLLGNDTGNDADLLTNKNALLLDGLEEAVKADEMKHETIFGAAVRLGSRVIISDRSVAHEYTRVHQALGHFKSYVEGINDESYMPLAEKKRLIDVLEGLISSVKEKSKERLRAEQLSTSIVDQYGNIISVIKDKDYGEVDRTLLLPGDNEYRLTLKNTLYRDFVRRVAESVKRSAPVNGANGSGIDFLAPFIESIAETTDTVTNMDLEPPHAISIYRKAREKIGQGIDLALALRGQDETYGKLAIAVEYLHRNLVDMIETRVGELKSRKKKETALGRDLEKFGIMREKMGDLEARMEEIRQPGLLKAWHNRIVSAGKGLHL
ncbi:hypothetical protein HYX08_05605 [Candidatus Woesearchaeota archaeon]|nr:hypothetical protein [Candidatus Woesearchaeota archaeon]